MKIILLSFEIAMLIFLGVACHKKEKSIGSAPDLLAYEQLESNHFVQMQPRSVNPVEPPANWITYSTSLGIKVSSPRDWKLVQQDDGIEIKNSDSSLNIKIQSEDASSFKLNKKSPGILSIKDFSNSKQLDEVLSASLPERNIFSRMGEDQKKDLMALLSKKIFFFSRYDNISFLENRYYLFKSTVTFEVMILVFLDTNSNEVIHIGGKWEGDENDLLMFLASINQSGHE
jgi:hypothetical protein